VGERSPGINVTILSGDLLGNDGPGSDALDMTRLDNVYNVVVGSGVDGTAILDGFTVSGGNAVLLTWDEPPGSAGLNSGAGMFNAAGSPVIRNCTFRANMTRSYHPPRAGACSISTAVRWW